MTEEGLWLRVCLGCGGGGGGGGGGWQGLQAEYKAPALLNSEEEADIMDVLDTIPEPAQGPGVCACVRVHVCLCRRGKHYMPHCTVCF